MATQNQTKQLTEEEYDEIDQVLARVKGGAISMSKLEQAAEKIVSGYDFPPFTEQIMVDGPRSARPLEPI